jgi:uncharacterized protein YjbI with pentapeptide repeats
MYCRHCQKEIGLTQANRWASGPKNTNVRCKSGIGHYPTDEGYRLVSYNLTGADLSGANLYDANLTGIKAVTA